ncbi:hypothetical protein RYH73_21755 [Olivibacter sp. CPCC 100613]|uniref:hypothetical protein n=1 Tax=Olivibacter sp. CPCC 100613 TaxID=3079931 RepID=UPI002FFB01AB
MVNSTIGSVKINDSVHPARTFLKTLMAIARGMKKDGYSDAEIAKETNLSLSLINKLKRKSLTKPS